MNLSIFAELELNLMHKARTSRGKAYEKVEVSRRVSIIEKFISDWSKTWIGIFFWFRYLRFLPKSGEGEIRIDTFIIWPFYLWKRLIMQNNFLNHNDVRFPPSIFDDVTPVDFDFSRIFLRRLIQRRSFADFPRRVV